MENGKVENEICPERDDLSPSETGLVSVLCENISDMSVCSDVMRRC